MDNQRFRLANTLLTLALAISWFSNNGLAQKTDTAVVEVGKVAKIRRTQSESFVGTFHPLRKSIIGSAVEGRISEMSVRPGESVANGQTLTRLQTGTLEIEIKSAELQLSLAEQALLELEKSMPKDMELAEARVRESAARLSFSKTEFDRSRRLRTNGGAISQGELELARSQYLADEETATSSKIEFERLTATKDYRMTQAKLNVEVARQEVRRLADQKQKHTVIAPYDSVVTAKLTDVGEWVTKGQAVVEVLQLDPIELIVNAPQQQLLLIQTSLTKSSTENPFKATIEVEGIERPITGIVKNIVSQADLRSRTFPVRIELKNQKLGDEFILQPGMLGRATLSVGAEAEMMVVKKDALVLGAGKKSVFKISSRNDDQVAVEVPVTTGASHNDWIQVTGDLSINDRVVLLGNERLRSGDRVNISGIDSEQPR